MKQILNSYYANNARKLHSMVDRILSKFGGLSDKDMDDFYSLANEVFVNALRRYDKEQSFDGFLYACLSNKIKTEMTRRNRKKRTADRMSVSLDTPVREEEHITIGDMMAGSYDLEKEVFGEESSNSPKIELYLCSLSKRQRRIVSMLAASYQAVEIRELLHMTQKEYSDAMFSIRAYEKVKILL